MLHRELKLSYLKENKNKDKKEKGPKNCEIKRKLQFQDSNNCLEATQLENKINQLVKNKADVGSIKKDHKEFIKSNKLILRSQQRIRSSKHNVFTEVVNRIALSANDDKTTQ